MIEDPSDPKKHVSINTGLRMAEVAARCGPLDNDMVELMRAIEAGALIGGLKGWVDPETEEED